MSTNRHEEMKSLYWEVFICPKDGRIGITNSKATINKAWLLNCGDCCDCKERAEYYGKAKGKFNFPEGKYMSLEDIAKLDKSKIIDK